MMCGGPSDEKPADEQIQQLLSSGAIKANTEKSVGKQLKQFDAVVYKSQVVAGTNFFVKVKVDDGEFVHIKVFRPLPHMNKEPELTGCQGSKGENDPIEYF